MKRKVGAVAATCICCAVAAAMWLGGLWWYGRMDVAGLAQPRISSPGGDRDRPRGATVPADGLPQSLAAGHPQVETIALMGTDVEEYIPGWIQELTDWQGMEFR